MNNEIDFIALLLHASYPVMAVMALLLGASMWSWWMIFRKKAVLGAAVAEAQAFEERFWSGADLAQLFKEVSASGPPSGLAGLFEAGFREFARLRSRKSIDPRVMMATIGSISPYVGLFGTVWGILISFQGLSKVGSATIAMVAPGISEALIATAMGLFAAIPAVIFYNRFSNQVERIETRYDTFQDEFSSILQRQANIEDHGH